MCLDTSLVLPAPTPLSDSFGWCPQLIQRGWLLPWWRGAVEKESVSAFRRHRVVTVIGQFPSASLCTPWAIDHLGLFPRKTHLLGGCSSWRLHTSLAPGLADAKRSCRPAPWPNWKWRLPSTMPPAAPQGWAQWGHLVEETGDYGQVEMGFPERGHRRGNPTTTDKMKWLTCSVGQAPTEGSNEAFHKRCLSFQLVCGYKI